MIPPWMLPTYGNAGATVGGGGVGVVGVASSTAGAVGGPVQGNGVAGFGQGQWDAQRAPRLSPNGSPLVKHRPPPAPTQVGVKKLFSHQIIKNSMKSRVEGLTRQSISGVSLW
jgi:hypothetical protein